MKRILLFAFGLMILSLAHAQNTWVPKGPYTWWTAVAASSDASHMIAAAYGDNLYLSTDFGNTWTGASTGTLPGFGWADVASSADGTNLLATGFNISALYVSTNAGANWRVSLTNIANWYPLFVSANGQKMVAGSTAANGKLFYSTNAGVSWTPSTAAQTWWRGICGTADGGTLWCADNNLGKIFKSTDSGATWNVLPASPQDFWVRMACSTNGSIVFAESNGGSNPARIYLSTDGGASWSPSGAPMGIWLALACSGDGRIVVAGSQDLGLYSSTDFGATWVPDNAPNNVFWTGAAMSADGTKMAATATAIGGPVNEYIYINVPALPILTISGSGANVILSWPTNAVAYHLAGNPDLASSSWTTVTNVPNVVGDQNEVTLPVGSNSFFRLQNP